MKLNNKEFKEFQNLSKKSNLTEDEKLRLAELKAKKDVKDKSSRAKTRKGSNGDYKFVPGNDFSWWSKFPNLLGDAVNLKSNFIPGRAIDTTDLNFTIPGVIEVDYCPTYGRNMYATDPINVFARDLYLRMWQKWRGITAYSASDLGIALIAELEIQAMVAHLERIYGIVNRYSRANINMPILELAALGYNQAQADYIRNHLSDFRYDLNVLIMRLQRLCLPKDISLIFNNLSLVGCEYLDHDDPKAQIILFRRSHYGIFSDTALKAGGCIDMVQCSPTGTTSTSLIDVTGTNDNMFPALEARVNALIGSDSIQKIFGDLFTWFGSEQMLQFEQLPAEYIVIPAYSESILHKLHNSDPTNWGPLFNVIMVGMDTADETYLKGVSAGNYTIYQYLDSIITQVAYVNYTGVTPTWYALTPLPFAVPTTSGSFTSVNSMSTVLDTYRSDMNEETVTEGMLFKNSVREYVPSTGKYVYLATSYGFEVITGFKLFTIDVLSGTVLAINVSTHASTNNAAAQAAGELAIMDWAPLVYHIDSAGIVEGIKGDMNVLVPVTPNMKKKALDAIVISGIHSEIRVLDTAVSK